MKKITLLTLFLASALLFQSCTPSAFNPYSTLASAEFRTYFHSSELELMTTDDRAFRSQNLAPAYSVIKATDGDTLNYVLISPRVVSTMRGASPIERHHWYRSAVMDTETAALFLALIEKNYDRWDTSIPKDKAEYEEFMHRAESGIYSLPEGSGVNPFFRYQFATTERGSRFSLTFSDGKNTVSREYNSRTDIEYLKLLLSKALD